MYKMGVAYKGQSKMCETKTRRESQSTWRYELEIQEGIHIKVDLSVRAFPPTRSVSLSFGKPGTN